MQTIMAWPVGRVGAAAVFEEDEIHFAPTHPLRLRLVNFDLKKDTEVFPPDDDEVRNRFFTELKKQFPPEPMCEVSCAPTQFEENLVFGLESSVSGDDFGFIASWNASGSNDAAISTVGEWFGLYIYRKSGESWRYCSRRIAADDAATIGAQMKADFYSAAKTCATFGPLKVAAGNSPFAPAAIKVRRGRKP